jgi:hypothetical protein
MFTFFKIHPLLTGKEIVLLICLIAAILITIFFVLKEIILIIYIKIWGKRSVGEIVGRRELPGQYQQKIGSMTQIKVQTPEIEFIFESMQVKYLKPLDFIKVPVIYVIRKNGKPIGRVDSLPIMLTDAIIWSIVSITLFGIYFLNS